MVAKIEEYAAVDAALAAVRSKLKLRMRKELIPTPAAFGRVSAAALSAPRDVPPFAASHMDGFAVVAEDMSGASEENPAVLKVTGTLKLGDSPRRRIRSGEAFQVSTGGAIPLGADAVLPAEHVRLDGGLLYVNSAVIPGRHVYQKGEEMKKGEVLIREGQVIRAQHTGFLLGLGVTKVRVLARPKVAILATGSELTRAAHPKPGKVPDSHSPYFVSLFNALGCDALKLGIVRDEPKLVRASLQKGLAAADFVVTLGGTSVGKADVVETALTSLKPDVLVHGIKMDRGRVAGIAVVGGKPVLMMPGPVQGATNALILFGAPVVGWLSGAVEERTKDVVYPLGGDWDARKRFSDFRKVVYVRMSRESPPSVEPLLGETESFRVLAEADGYVVVPENVTHMSKGDLVSVKLLPGFSFA